MAAEDDTSGPNPSQAVLGIATGYIASAGLNVAVELEIAERLAGGPRPVADLAVECEADEDALYRSLRMLASFGVFAEGPTRSFANTPSSETLIPNEEGSMHSLIRWICDPLHLRSYAELMHSVRTGKPCFDKVFGMPLFEYMPTAPRESEVFNDAMTDFSAAVIPAVLEAYDFDGIGTLIDIAGGHGEVLCSILEKYPQMQGVLTDFEHVLAHADEVIDRHRVATRIRREPVDFFKGVPTDGDAYIMKHILHDWDDERSRVILHNIREAMGDGPGRLILLETVLSSGNEPHLGKLIDIEMLTLPGGKERTESEWRTLLESGGFRLTRVIEMKSALCVIEAQRAN